MHSMNKTGSWQRCINEHLSHQSCVRLPDQLLRMRVLEALLTTLLLLLLRYDLTSGATDPIYLVAVTSQAVSGTKETLCAHINEPNKTLSLVVTLSSAKGNLTILKEGNIKKDFYKCVPFQVPVVLTDYVATVYVEIRGQIMFLNKTTKILIKPPTNLILIQTDKPIYKPGETVKCRIVSLGFSFSTYNQKFPTVELQDPNSNRIRQWMNQTTKSGILDLFHRTTPQAIQGYYTITAWDEKNQPRKQRFELKEYVLPKFEVIVNLPHIITTMNKEFTLQVCAKYTYGKAVQGSGTAEVCRRGYWYRWPMPDQFDTCRTYSITTDRTGCGSQVINVTDYNMNQGEYFQVKAKVEEDETEIIVEGTAKASYTTDYVRVSFVDETQIYRPGIAYEGKVLVSDILSKPMEGQTVYIIASYDSISVNVTLTTDSNGTAHFSFNTTDWSNQVVSLLARHKDDFNQYRPSSRYYFADQLGLRPFYSKSKSVLKLITAPKTLSCVTDADVEASYIIQGKGLKKGQKTLDFFYMVASKGSMAQNGRVSVQVNPEIENKGEVKFTLKKTTALSPFAQVVLYTILPNRETVADSLRFPVEQCLPNKVSLSFSNSTALPKEKATLNLKAQPGSLCSVRSIDQSVLLLKPEAALNPAYVFGMLPVQMLVGYPHQVEDLNNYPCIPRKGKLIDEEPVPIVVQPREKRSGEYYEYSKDNAYTDAYTAFKATGIKIATNSDVKEPVYCYYETINMLRPMIDTESRKVNIGGSLSVEAPVQNTIRKFFPETWIWDLVPVGKSGSATLKKTVPDTITKWATGAFCTSSVGFGLAPSTELTAFQPFFVSLALPYSVIRGETLTLKASVFNYLSKCIMVKVTLASSTQFTALPCNGCNYTQCICSDESKTFQWTVTPSVLGQVSVTVRAETVQTQERCGNALVTVPEGRRIDTVVQSFLVESEGTKQTVTHNELICLTDTQVNTTVPLTLPEVFVKGSATSVITVLGDLMGSALKNIADLLAMPYGCGEQNMLNFAPNIYILQYLESTGQLTPEILSRAKTFMETGYQTELAYKHNDGSYSAYGKRDPSGNTWLTAFVMKIFGGAKKHISVDQTYIDQAKNWLGQQQQTVNGCFTSVGKLSNNAMKGGVRDDITLTAYITAALLELGVNKSDPMVAKGLVCLKEASSNLDNTYFTALLSYTFTLAGDQEMRQNLISNLDRRARREDIGRYWTQGNNGASFEIETSSYVLLALLSGPTLPTFELNYSATIVRWLTKKQNPYGGFSTTQDTVVALQALAKYSAATYSPEGSVVVNVTSPSGQKYDFTVNQRNRLLYQEKQLRPPNGTFTLWARGKGCVFVQFALHYNIPPPANSSAFSLIANATSVCNGRKYFIVTLSFTVRYKGPREETNMMIIDVKLLSGFVLDSLTLQALTGDPRVRLLEQNKGHVILYLDGMKKTEEKSFTLKLWQEVVVKNLKPAVVTVYDYYKTSEGAVSEYICSCV